ncbi:hypothetical protein IMZ48_30430 [Candidatus Bathyarchaeota archaeon]|nr:hypothetical protein [Candidatus Bathyarchaeota archaeon]
MMSTSDCASGPRRSFTVATSSVTFVAPVVSYRSLPEITRACSPVASVVSPRSKSSDGRIGSP